jgi:chemotaxis protein MotA
MSFPIGLFILFAVLFSSIGNPFSGGISIQLLANSHAAILVLFGTFGVLLASMSFDDHLELIKLFKSAFTQKQEKENAVQKELLSLSKKKSLKVETKSELINYAQELWEEGVDAETFEIFLSQKLNQINSRGESAILGLRNLAKYPPALGMIGTVVGLVSLFSGLTLESRDKIGPSLALALTATFYGLVLSNMVLMPFADRLMTMHNQRVRKNEYIFGVLMLINRGDPVDSITRVEAGAKYAS